MSTPTAPSFLDLLRQSRLLDPEQLDSIGGLPQAQGVDTGTLTKCLIQLGLLTPYQVEQLLAGKGPTLSIGRYQVIGRLETTGAPAYMVRHRDRPGKFVLKLLPAGASCWPQLEQEAGQAGRLRHPHLEGPTEVGVIDFKRVYVRPYVEGFDLGRQIRDGGPLPHGQACELIRQAAAGMDHAHVKGLTHRRLRPTNLIVVQTPGAVGAPSATAGNGHADASASVVKIVDLGLGSLPTERKAAAPTAPGGTDPGVSQDVRDLGRAFAFLLGLGAGARPAEPVPPEVVDVVKKMQTTGADSGYRSLAEVADALRPWCPAPPPPPLELTSEFPALPTVDLPALPPEIAAFTIGEPTADPIALSAAPLEAPAPANGHVEAATTHPTPAVEIPAPNRAPEVTAFAEPTAAPLLQASAADEYPPPELLFPSSEPSVQSKPTLASVPPPLVVDASLSPPAEAPWPQLSIDDPAGAAPAPPVPASEAPLLPAAASLPPAQEEVTASPASELADEAHQLDFSRPSAGPPGIGDDLGSYVKKAPARRPGARRKRGPYFWLLVGVGALLWLIVIVLAVICFYVFSVPAPQPTRPQRNTRRAAAALVRPFLPAADKPHAPADAAGLGRV